MDATPPLYQLLVYVKIAGEAASNAHRRHERRPQLQVRAEGAHQARPRHVQRRSNVQDDGVYAQVQCVMMKYFFDYDEIL